MSLLLSDASIHRFAGTLAGPDDDGRLIARCESVADAAAALAHARAHGIEVGSGLVIDLDRLDAVHVDPARRIAWAQPGARWADLDDATQQHGLAVTGCRVASRTVAGSTLASGSGWLERKLGLAGDNLRTARVLTAVGQVVTASATDNEDLFWALRGGGNSFGIVVELEFALRPIGPVVLAGTLRWPRERAAAVVRAYRDLMAEAPDALCGGVELTTDAVAVHVLYTGTRGAEHLAPLRALAPAADTVTPTGYCAFQALMDDEPPVSTYLDDLPDAAIDAVLAARSSVLVQPLGGAYGRVGELDTAAGRRDAAWRVAGFDLGAWSRPAHDAERRARLAAVKARWDPENVLGGA